MSFINLMANDVWSEADIKARLHAEIRSSISEMVETELNRALQGLALGLHALSTSEQEVLQLFKAETNRVALLGVTARADMALLTEVLALEAAKVRLAEPVVDPLAEPEAVALDAQERQCAQIAADAASPQARALFLLRNPTPDEESL